MLPLRCVLNGEHFVKPTEVVDLVLSELLALLGKLFTAHLVPVDSRLFVQFLEVSISGDSVQIPLTGLLIDTQDS